MDHQPSGARSSRRQAGERPAREFVADGRRWRATLAWRATDGAGLCYFFPVDEAPDGGDGGDRRARLEPGRALADATEGEVTSLFREAVPLTATERRFRAPDGRWWLAQNIGPVWAEGGAAEGATGILFTALEGPPERGETGGGHVSRMEPDALERAWRRALASPDTDGTSRGDASAEAGPEDA